MSKKARARRADITAALENFDRLPDSSHVRVPVVAALFGCGRSTIWQWTKDGRLPAAKKLGPRTTGWNVGELRAILSPRTANTDKVDPRLTPFLDALAEMLVAEELRHRQVLGELVTAGSAAGLSVLDAAQLKPSLETVFLTLTGREYRE